MGVEGASKRPGMGWDGGCVVARAGKVIEEQEDGTIPRCRLSG